MAGRIRSILAATATVVGSLGIVRLVDAVGKRELMRAESEVRAELTTVRMRHDSCALVRDRLALDESFLNHRIASLSKREPYFIIDRARSVLILAVQEKSLLEAQYRLRGPERAQDDFSRLSRVTLQVLGKRLNTDWSRPGWLYRLEGIEPPADSAARVVPAAFGAGEVFLGGDLVIHGPASDSVPPEAIDHSYLELSEQPLRAVLDAVKPGTQVLIR